MIADAVPARTSMIALIAMLLVGTMVPPEAQSVTPPDGDWYISENILVDGESLTLKGNVYILDGASLTLNGSNLNISDQWTITVQKGGRLDIFGSNVSAQYKASWWQNILIFGNSTIEHSTFVGLSVNLDGGANLFANKCEFRNCENAIEAQASRISVWNCKFVDISRHCIGLYGSDATILGCRFFRRSSDVLEWSDSGGNMAGPMPGVTIVRSAFRGYGYTAVRLGYSTNYANTAVYSEQWHNGPPTLYMDLCCIAGFNYGVQVDVEYPTVTYLIDTSTFDNFTYGIELYFSPYYAEVTNTIFQNCSIGLQLRGGGIRVMYNKFTDCSSSAMDDYYGYYYDYYRAGCSIEGNIIARCKWGISLSEFQGELKSNTFLDCNDYGFYTLLGQASSKQLLVEGNKFTNCSRYSDQYYAALMVQCSSDNRIRVTDNEFVDNRGTGIRASGKVTVYDNLINGSRVGLRLEESQYPMELDGNTIIGGDLGMDLGSQTVATRNNITGVKDGIHLNIAGSSRGESSLCQNLIESSETGIRIIDKYGGTNKCETLLEGNGFVSGGEAIFLDRANASIVSCKFEGTQGYGIHAVGSAPLLGTNDYGTTAEGIVWQEWYLTLTGQERSGPDWSGPWVASAGALVTTSDRTGEVALRDRCGNGGSLHTNLTQYTIALNESRTELSPYNISLLKPKTGSGKATVDLVNNTNALISLFPLPDLALEFLDLPAPRPVPDSLVPVNITVINDATYMPEPRTYSSIKVLLTDNGNEVNQRIVSNIFYAEWCNVTFMWTAKEGHHILEATLDPENVVEEVFEANNRISIEVSINVRPVASMEVDRTEAVAGEEVQFSANGSSDDSAVSGFLYDFGDGSESGWTEDGWAVHRYQKPGNYEPRLMVRDSDGAMSDWTVPIPLTITGRSLDITLSTDRTFVDSLEAVTFSASARKTGLDIIDYLWDFGDGSTDYGRNASRVEHVYQRSGAFTVTIRITEVGGSNGTATLNILVRNRPPNSSFTYSPERPTVLAEVSFASTSTDPDGGVVRWLWDFGDGTQSWGPTPTHLYMDDGRYAVILAVLDDSGSWSTPVVHEVAVSNLAPRARAVLSIQPLRVGQSALFDGTFSSDPDDLLGSLMYCWSSPDGWRSEGPKLTRHFDAAGKYTLKLTVTDDDGASDSVEVSFEVNEKGTIVPGLDYRPAALGLIGISALMFSLTFAVRRKLNERALSESRTSRSKKDCRFVSNAPPKK